MELLLGFRRYLIYYIGCSSQILFIFISQVLSGTTTAMLISTDSTTDITSTEGEGQRKESTVDVATTTPLVITETTTEYITTTTDKSYTSEEAFLTDDMINGLAAGFGFFFGTIILIVLLWCLCCTNNCMKKDEPQKLMRPRVGPSPPPKTDTRNRS